MQMFKRAMGLSCRPARLIARRQPRRYASTEHHSEDHAQSVNEGFGRGFYIAIAAVPMVLAGLKFARSSSDNETPFLTRLIERWSDMGQQWTDRNALHTRMIEQAAHDRNLFQSARPSPTVDLRFPEIFNTGSPYNVPAGHGGANLDKLIAHYEKQNRDEEERKLKALEAKKNKQ